MKAKNMLSNNKKITKFTGNPIIDIFYEARERFGSYKTYTTKADIKKIKDLHLTSIAEF